jgi:hypothetical protein
MGKNRGTTLNSHRHRVISITVIPVLHPSYLGIVFRAKQLHQTLLALARYQRRAGDVATPGDPDTNNTYLRARLSRQSPVVRSCTGRTRGWIIIQSKPKSYSTI